MSGAFAPINTTACRTCGAVYAALNSHKVEGVCATCFNKYQAFSGQREYDESAFITWMAHSLTLQLRRFNNVGFSRRCEAIVTSGSGANDGYQCGSPAAMHIDCRYLCAIHGKRTGIRNVILVDQVNRNEYERFTSLIAEISRKDEKFVQCVQHGLAIAKLHEKDAS